MQIIYQLFYAFVPHLKEVGIPACGRKGNQEAYKIAKKKVGGCSSLTFECIFSYS